MATWRRADEQIIVTLGALAVLAVLASPFLWGIGRAITLTPGREDWLLWWPSVSLAACAATIASVLGIAGFWSLASRRASMSGWVLFAVAASCALPSYIHALAWSWVLPPVLIDHPRLAASVVLGCSYAPISFLVLHITLRAVPHELIEAAWTTGLTPPQARLLIARSAAPSILAAWLVAFLMSFADFPVADLFRVATYSTEVFARVAAWMDPAAAARLAIPILLTGLITVAALTRFFDRAQISNAASHAASQAAGNTATLIARSLAGVLFVTAVAGVPIVALASRVSTFEPIGVAYRALLPELPGTAAMGLTVGIVASLYGAILAYAGARADVRGAWFGRIAVWIALGWPAALVCLGAISLSTALGNPQGIFEWVPMLAVLTLRCLVLPYEIWRSFWMRTPRALEEACWLVGIPWRGAIMRLLWPHGPVAFSGAALLAFCFAVNDLTALVLLAPPGFSTSTLNIFSAVHYGSSSYLAALCLWQVAGIAIITCIAGTFIRLSSDKRYANAAD